MKILIKHQLFLFLSFLLPLTLLGKGHLNKNNHIAKVAYNKHLSIVQSGNALQQISNDGFFPSSDNNGLWLINKNVMFPKVDDYYSNYYWQSGCVYQEGVLWGGKVNDGQSPGLRVNGATYSTGMTPGGIWGIRTGNVENPDDPNVKIWRVRRDWQTADLSEESYFLSKSEQEIKDAYQKDWLNWPAEKGAPFEDVDGDGQYNPDVDIPGVPGADQTIWYVANDIYGEHIYGSPSIGIEMQMTLWSYNRPAGNPLNDMIFKRVQLIYKGTSTTSENATIDSMFITQWVDPDVGDATNDLVGCDTTLQLAFSYNAQSEDEQFIPYDMKPPVIGYMLLAGPLVYSPSDTAVFNFRKITGWRNLHLSSFYWFASGYDQANDPSFDYQGATEWYNLMRGFMPQPGYPSAKPWIDPTNGLSTKFPLYGDPLQKSGWIDGVYVAPEDRRMGLSTGPFQMALGDTQEVAYAFLGENWFGKQAYIQAIAGLKSKARTIKNFLKKGFSVSIVAEKKQFHTDSLAYLKSQVVFLGTLIEIEQYKWKIINSPLGSHPQLNISQDSLATFSADEEGFYTIQVTTITSEGKTNTGEITLYAYSGQPPAANFVLDKNEIFWGDSILADASPSFDPDGDSLSFLWSAKNLSSWRSPIMKDKENARTIISPLNAGKYSIKLKVSDGMMEDTFTKQFEVKPLLNNMVVKNTLSDTCWYRAYPFYYQDYILVPLYGKGFLRIYKIQEDGINLDKDVALPDTNYVRVDAIKKNYIFIGKQCDYCGYWGPGPVSIFHIDDDWNLTMIKENYFPDQNYSYDGIYSISFIHDSAFVYYEPNNYAWIDFLSDPANPTILKQKEFQYNLHIKSSNEKYIFFSKSGDSDSLYIYDKKTFAYRQSVDWQKRFYYSDWANNKFARFSINKDFLFAGNNDSLVIYKINSDFSLTHHANIKATPPFINAITDHVDNLPCYSGSLIQDNILRVKRHGFSFLYDITDPDNPYLFGYYGDGYYYWSIEKSDDHYFLSNTDLMPNSTLSEISIPYLTTIPKAQQGVPINFHLYANYPNPFNPETHIAYDLPVPSKVKITIYNLLGQKIRTLVNTKKLPGRYEVKWDGKNENGIFMSSGEYFYRLETDKGFAQTKKLLLLK